MDNLSAGVPVVPAAAESDIHNQAADKGTDRDRARVGRQPRPRLDRRPEVDRGTDRDKGRVPVRGAAADKHNRGATVANRGEPPSRVEANSASVAANSEGKACLEGTRQPARQDSQQPASHHQERFEALS